MVMLIREARLRKSRGLSIARLKRLLVGQPRSIKDPAVFHKISLIAFLAWVGLGADGLSSSAYGPEESFRALGTHTYLAVALALATAFTVFVISYAYSRIIEEFPAGGGGYLVASKLLGPEFGVVSGSALLVDYVLTISVSIASGADQVFSVLPPGYHSVKLSVVVVVIVMLMVLNLRGVKESVTSLMPVFVLFVVCHLIVLVGGIGSHLGVAGAVAGEVREGFSNGLTSLGFAGIAALFLRAYSMGAGTYTGIEAVSNGIQIMREPKVATARRTMLYMAISLAVTAGGILVLYLLFRVTPVHGKTMNAVLLENFTEGWMVGGVPVGSWFVVVTLASEAALLFVAAQAGFIDGPRVMANMAADSWLPRRFSSLSDRLTMQNGVVLISVSAIAILLLTKGETRVLILMYSINVFLTFSLSEFGMVRHWFIERRAHPDWKRHIMIHLIGLILCLGILTVSLAEKFHEGGWITLIITTGMILLCINVRRHYTKVSKNLHRLDSILSDIPMPQEVEKRCVDQHRQTAVLLVKEYGGLGVHSLLSIQRLFPQQFENVVFLTVISVDAGALKGEVEIDHRVAQARRDLDQYTHLAHQAGLAADSRIAVGTDVVDEAAKMADGIAREYPRTIFFASKLVFEEERWYQGILHNETAYAVQRRLQFAGMNCMVLPVRVYGEGNG